MNFKYILKAFKAEWLKIKGLGLLYTGIAIAGIMPLILLIATFVKQPNEHKNYFNTSIFDDLIESFYASFGNFFLLIFIIIVASRIAQSDHRNNGWNFIETQPLSKLSIYTAKFLCVVTLSTITTILFYIFTIVAGVIIQLVFPNDTCTLSIDFAFLSHSFIRIWLLSLGIIALQMMLSMIFSGFIWAFIIGFLGFVINVVAQIRGEVYNYIVYNNMAVGTSIDNPKMLNTYLNYTECLSIFWAVVFFVVGYVIYSQKGIKNAFFKSGKRLAFSVLGLACIVGSYWLLIQPRYTEKLEGKTIVEGTINTKMKADAIHILEGELGTSIAEIPIKNGQFRWETKDKLPFGTYIVEVNKRRKKIYLAQGDEIHLDIKMDEKSVDFSETGTRKAEKEFLSKPMFSESEFDDAVARKRKLDKPEEFYNLAIEKWEDDKKQLNTFRSTENIALSKDFTDYMYQVKAVDILNKLYDYQKITSFTDKAFAIPKDFEQELLSVIEKPKPNLLANKDYQDWRFKQLLPKEGTANPDSIILAKLHQMPKSEVKDQLLSAQMIKILKLTNDKKAREDFFEKRVNELQNDKYKNFVATQLILINNQQKGADFPQLEVVDKDGKTVNLSQKFKGKYIIIDWWATWCNPCKVIKPSYEYEAKKYINDDKVVFVSISLDDDKKAWDLEIKNDKSSVKHFWLKDKNAIKGLNIQGIPRFMIVDKEGKMYNADLARPGETNFREALSEITFSYRVFKVF